jgi:hypothetical protein
MVKASEIREHLHVHSNDGEHIGTVDRVEGDQIKLAKLDRAADGQHHQRIPVAWAERVDSHAVYLSKSAAEARAHWSKAGAA